MKVQHVHFLPQKRKHEETVRWQTTNTPPSELLSMTPKLLSSTSKLKSELLLPPSELLSTARSNILMLF
jgi:hypothetical protein